jgi:hypothetical protein
MRVSQCGERSQLGKVHQPWPPLGVDYALGSLFIVPPGDLVKPKGVGHDLLDLW